MQNRSSTLPVFYSNNEIISFESPFEPHIHSLDVYDFTYLHFHDFLEIGYCIEGTGICCVEDTYYEFKKGDVQVIFPFQRHLSKSTGSENSRWYWININLYSLMEQAGFLNAAQITHMINHEMGLCGIFSPEEYPEICRLVSELLEEISNQSKDILYHKEMCAGFGDRPIRC